MFINFRGKKLTLRCHEMQGCEHDISNTEWKERATLIERRPKVLHATSTSSANPADRRAVDELPMPVLTREAVSLTTVDAELCQEAIASIMHSRGDPHARPERHVRQTLSHLAAMVSRAVYVCSFHPHRLSHPAFHSFSINSTITVPFFSPASAIDDSSTSIKFLPILISSKSWPACSSNGEALSHS
jgi:hypothetical protein